MKITNLAYLTVVGALLVMGRISLANDKNAFQGSIPIKGVSRSEYTTLAKVSIQDAISTAHQATNGKVTEATLDSEGGFLVYEIDVVMPDQKRRELIIDAGDGKVLLTKEKNRKFSSEDHDDKDED